MDTRSSLQAYKETQIKTANQGRLIVMLYDGAIRFVNLAIDGLEAGPPQYDQINNHIIKAQDIITELMVSLDRQKGGEIAGNLFKIYIFMSRLLIEGNIKKDITPLDSVRNLLGDLREVWIEVTKKNGHGQDLPETSGINIAG